MEVDEISAATSLVLDEECVSMESECLSAASSLDRHSELSAASCFSGSKSLAKYIQHTSAKGTKKRARGGYASS